MCTYEFCRVCRPTAFRRLIAFSQKRKEHRFAFSRYGAAIKEGGDTNEVYRGWPDAGGYHFGP